MSQFRLPEDLTDPGDPVTGNPFDDRDPRHNVWDDATREAEQEVARINAWVLSRAAKTGDGFGVLVDQVEAWGAKFDAWAKRGIKVVWSDAEMHAYERWLLEYANARISLTEQSFDSYYHESLLLRLRNLLSSRVYYWKAEVRRYRAEQDRHRAEPRSPFKAPRRVSDEVIKHRKALVGQFRRDRDLTAEQMAREAGMSETALRAVVREDRKRGFADATRDRLLKLLGVSVETWYAP